MPPSPSSPSTRTAPLPSHTTPIKASAATLRIPSSNKSSSPFSSSSAGPASSLKRQASLPRKSSPLASSAVDGRNEKNPPARAGPDKPSSSSLFQPSPDQTPRPSPPPKISMSPSPSRSLAKPSPSPGSEGQQHPDGNEPSSPTFTAQTFISRQRRPPMPSPSPSFSTCDPLPSAFPSSYESSRGGGAQQQRRNPSQEGSTVSASHQGDGWEGGVQQSMQGGSSMWEGGTELEDVEMDEDLEEALDRVREVSMLRASGYKSLLVQSQTAASYQLHALQAELRATKHELVVLKKSAEAQKNLRPRTPLPLTNSAPNAPSLSHFILPPSTSSAELSEFDELSIRRALRSLPQVSRTTLLRIILESSMPGDISSMIRILQKYLLTSFDILGSLPEELAVEVLSRFDVEEVLGFATVSRKWNELINHPLLWRHYALLISWTDPVPPKDPDQPSGWLPLYRALHFRERNWEKGLSQKITVLKGHQNFVTSLQVHGDVLITGSYDETIRIWDLPSASCKLVLRAKAIACLQFFPESSVFAVGFHDVGRTQVWSSVTWQPLQTLGGHLHGIRAVDLNDRYLVSAGADKAIVVWEWRTGQKVTRFGQQTNVNIGIQLLNDDTILSLTLDGIIRCFSISKREMICQYRLSELAGHDFHLALKLQHVGGGPLGSGQLVWMAAKGANLTCATKNLIIHLEWDLISELVRSPRQPPYPSSQHAPREASKRSAGSSKPANTRLSAAPSRRPSKTNLPAAASSPRSVSTAMAPPAPGQRPTPTARRAASGSHTPSSSLSALSPRGTPSSPSGSMSPRKLTTSLTPSSSRERPSRLSTAGIGLGLGLTNGTPSPRSRTYSSIFLPSSPHSPATGSFSPTTADGARPHPAIRPSPGSRRVSSASMGTTTSSGYGSPLGASAVPAAAAAAAMASNGPDGTEGDDGEGVIRTVPDCSKPPRLISVIDSPEISIGAVDVWKKRVVTSTRFSSRSGADRRLFVSTYSHPTTTPSASASSSSSSTSSSSTKEPETPPPPVSLLPVTLRGAWEDEAGEERMGLKTPGKGPMSCVIDHEKVVVGCADGTIYIVHFV